MSQLEKRFVIVSGGRSGSTLLVDLLGSHPEITCDPELLNERFWRRLRRPLLWFVRALPRPYLEYKARRALRSAYGFKLKTGGQVVHLGSTLSDLHHSGWKILHLRRHNAFQQTMSWCAAEVTGRWQSQANRPFTSNAAIHIEPRHFLQNLRTCLNDRKELDNLTASLPHLELVYEDDLQNHENWPALGQRISSWLGISPAPLTSQVIKTWSQPYHQVVENFAELVQAAKDSLDLPQEVEI